MSDASNFDVAAGVMSLEEPTSPLIRPTVLAASMQTSDAQLPLTSFCGVQTVSRFTSLSVELKALLRTAGMFDLGWRTCIQVTGEDRLRWMSGMVTNAVQLLPEYEGNYSFFLNAQGRIQGDAFVYREPDRLVLETSHDQTETIIAHLDRFIIMDDVALENLQASTYSVGLAGPHAEQILAAVGVSAPVPTSGSSERFNKASMDGFAITIVAMQGIMTPRYVIRCAPADASSIWETLLRKGVEPCGIEALEALRIVEGLPLYGVDINDRDLPQETSQVRALNFNKGCYLGQEIVERIRSRGAVHKGLRQFSLQGEIPTLPADLLADGVSIGRLASAVSIETPAGTLQYAIGIVRTDAMTRAAALTYNGGTAVALEQPPVISF